MKINNLNDKKKRLSDSFRKDPGSLGTTSGRAVGGQGGFQKVFSLKRAEIDDDLLNRTIAEIDRLGALLEKDPHIANYNKYRSQIKSILNKLVPNAFGIGKSLSKPSASNLQQKEYQVIKVIDKELESLLAYIKDKENGHLKIAATVVSIKGLIIDVLR